MSIGDFRLKDSHGNDLCYGNRGEFWAFPNPEIEDYREHFQQVRHLEMIDGDVILASHPRSGTYWHHQIIVMLMNESTEYSGHMDKDHLDWCPFEKLTRPETPRLYATHVPRFRLLPKQSKEKDVKVIYCYRNPKDCWVSWYNMVHHITILPTYEGTWDQFFDLMMDCGYWYGDWFDHVLDYEKAAREQPDHVFLSCYETMKKDPVGQVVKLNQFLGLNRTRQLCEDIAEACHFSALKAAKEPQDPHFHGEESWKKGAPGCYRKGEIGDWKNWFTETQSNQLDAVFNKRMKHSHLPFFFE